jgi:hypothetical protein
MAHFESFPPGALVGLKSFANLPPAPWANAYRALIRDVRQAGRCHLHELEVAATWRGCIDRVLLRGAYADLGLTVGYGAAAIWLDRRIDAFHVGRAVSPSFRTDAEAWFGHARPRFLALLRALDVTPHHIPTALAA